MSDNGHRPLTIGVVGTGAGVMRLLGGDDVAPIKHPITAPPVVQGEHGKAWLCDTAVGRRQKSVADADDACLAHWIIEAPRAHPVWHSYSLVLIHLRAMPGKRTLIYLDEATHELWLYALNPDADRNPMLATGIVDCWMRPGNFASQFIELSDELARDRVRQSVQTICDGKLSPDTDWRQAWIKLYGDNMQKDRPHRRPPQER